MRAEAEWHSTPQQIANELLRGWTDAKAGLPPEAGASGAYLDGHELVTPQVRIRMDRLAYQASQQRLAKLESVLAQF